MYVSSTVNTHVKEQMDKKLQVEIRYFRRLTINIRRLIQDDLDKSRFLWVFILVCITSDNNICYEALLQMKDYNTVRYVIYNTMLFYISNSYYTPV